MIALDAVKAFLAGNASAFDEVPASAEQWMRELVAEVERLTVENAELLADIDLLCGDVDDTLCELGITRAALSKARS